MRYLLFILTLLMLLPATVLAQDDVQPDDDTGELRQTLAMVSTIGNFRTKVYHLCSIYARDLEGTGVTLADLPPFLDPDLMLRLTDGDAANGELFGVGVTQPDIMGRQKARLIIEVPEDTRYLDMIPARLPRIGLPVYYGKVDIASDMAAEICQFDNTWCDGCQ